MVPPSWLAATKRRMPSGSAACAAEEVAATWLIGAAVSSVYHTPPTPAAIAARSAAPSWLPARPTKIS